MIQYNPFDNRLVGQLYHKNMGKLVNVIRINLNAVRQFLPERQIDDWDDVHTPRNIPLLEARFAEYLALGGRICTFDGRDYRAATATTPEITELPPSIEHIKITRPLKRALAKINRPEDARYWPKAKRERKPKH